MLYVSFHGGADGVDNLGAYDDCGMQQSLEVLRGAPGGRLSELRAFKFVADGMLWVLSGSKHASAILAFEGSGTEYRYKATVAEYATLSSLWHPFDFTLYGSTCYVSAQDTNVVVRLDVSADMLSATPAAVAPALPDGGTFLPGTFVASADGDLPEVPPTTPVDPAAGGLEVDCHSGKVSNSVRGVLWVNGALYVADEVAGQVKVYDAEGKYLGAGPVKGPVHLMALEPDGATVLYVCNGHDVLAGTLSPDDPADLTLEPIAPLALDKLSGLAYDGSGTLYAASRAEDLNARPPQYPRVHTFTGFPSAPQAGPSFTVADAPEFLLYVDSG